jgi:hypothetical protein
MVRGEEPLAIAANENIRGLYGGFVEAIREGRRDVLGACHPACVALDAYPNGAERNAHALGVRENSRPALAHFLPAQQKIPSRMNAFDAVVMRPDGLHLGEVERFESDVEALVREAERFFGGLPFGSGLASHSGSEKSLWELDHTGTGNHFGHYT